MATHGTAAAHDTLQERVRMALELRTDGRLAEALDLLSRPGEYAQDVYILRGDLQMELGRVHEAVGSYSTVIALDRGNTYAQQKLALCLRQLEKWEPAVETLGKVLAQDSYCDSARIALGECLLHLKRPEDALACFEACWSEGAVLPSLFGKAVALHLLQRRDQAEAMYERLLQQAPDHEEALANLITLSMELYSLDRIQHFSERLVGLRPDSAIGLSGLLVTALERHEYDRAAVYYQRLSAVDPESVVAGAANSEPVEYLIRQDDVARLQGHTRHDVQHHGQPRAEYRGR